MRKKTGYLDLICGNCQKIFSQVGTHYRRQNKEAKMRDAEGNPVFFCSRSCLAVYRENIYFIEAEACKKRIPERFWSFVNKDPGQGPDSKGNTCWEWTGARFEKGHGSFPVNTGKGKVRCWIATRALFELILDIRIPKGFYICHKCDNPPCVNPDHLYFGSPRDNSDDKVRAKRHLFGERAIAAKLKDNDVIAIRELHKKFPHKTAKEIISELSLSITDSTICNILRGKTWQHLL